MSQLTHKISSQRFALGPIQGTCDLPGHVKEGAAQLADAFFTAQEAIDWAGNQVETEREPSWLLQDGAVWRPDVSALGLRRADGRTGFEGRCELVLTAGVDPHEDHVHGLVLMVVLHNDGLKFRQGRVSHAPKAGDWFIFDDRRPHSVSSAKGRATFVGWAIPVERC